MQMIDKLSATPDKHKRLESSQWPMGKPPRKPEAYKIKLQESEYSQREAPQELEARARGPTNSESRAKEIKLSPKVASHDFVGREKKNFSVPHIMESNY